MTFSKDLNGVITAIEKFEYHFEWIHLCFLPLLIVILFTVFGGSNVTAAHSNVATPVVDVANATGYGGEGHSYANTTATGNATARTDSGVLGIVLGMLPIIMMIAMLIMLTHTVMRYNY